MVFQPESDLPPSTPPGADTQEPASSEPTQKYGLNVRRDVSGIALFMVLGAVAMLTVLVAEFTYVSQVNQTIAYGALDELKAHYLAKSGLKLSLLRLKAYQQVKGLVKNMGKGANGAVPKNLIEKIWNFPFFFPIPTNIPGLNRSDQDAIAKFQKESGLDGKFSAVIESESSRFNLNFIVPGYAPLPTPSPSASASPSPTPSTSPSTTPTGTPVTTPSATPTFEPEAARASLSSLLGTILNQKFEDDPDFAANYRDLRLDDLVDNIAAWADRTYERRTTSNRDKVVMKRGPFYSITELHFLANVDDDIYNLITPVLTVSPTAGINVNTIEEASLRVLIPLLVKEDRAEFFKYRDNPEQDNSFATPDDFFKYLQSVGPYRDSYVLEQFKADLQKRNISIVTEEQYFKITVEAKVNSATRTIEAWVTLGTPDPSASQGPNGQRNPFAGGGPGGPGGNPGGNPGGTPGTGPGGTSAPGSGSESGLKITSMKIH